MNKRNELSVDALVASASGKDAQDDTRWGDVAALQDRADEEVFAAASRLIASGDASKRRLGVDILAQGQVAQKPLRERALPPLVELAAHEQHPDVVAALCHAFGHLHDEATIDLVRGWAAHPDENVRFGVVQGLSGYDDPGAIETLIHLSTDADSDVRDWATFGLGSQTGADTPAVRQALRTRLDDSDNDTFMEALAGLARRCDPGVIAALRVLLSDMNKARLPLDAALVLADPIFHAALTRFAAAWERDEVLMNVVGILEEAIAERLAS